VVVAADAASRHPVAAAESDLVRRQLADARNHTAQDVAAAWQRLVTLGAALRDGIGAGVLVLPTLPGPPPTWEELADVDGRMRGLGRLTRLCAPVNSSGLVAASLPWGVDGAGLPVGVQLVAATEATLVGAVETLAG
jgi:Asp-tRNA(Asn)/Glu-tRNA(Gln) amidotransferase A subunit family amidase